MVRCVHTLSSPATVLMYYGLGYAFIYNYQKRSFSVETTEVSYKVRCTLKNNKMYFIKLLIEKQD